MFGAEKIMVLRVLVINSSEMIPAAVPFTKGFSSFDSLIHMLAGTVHLSF